MISIDNVSFGYGEAQETLSQVSAAIAPGECVLLCGASGCGKTTVTKLINGLIPSFTPGCRLEGRVEVDGLDPGTTPMYELARKVGSVFQNPKSQFFNLDTDSELAFGLENEGRPPEEIRRRVADTVEALHLQELQRRSIFSLSGGQKQLLAFGSVYAMGPEVFVLDVQNPERDIHADGHDAPDESLGGHARQGVDQMHDVQVKSLQNPRAVPGGSLLLYSSKVQRKREAPFPLVFIGQSKAPAYSAMAS